MDTPEQHPNDEEPLTLEEACRVVFGDRIKPASLRAEWKRGRLEIERVGRQQFVTRRGLREMRKLCQERGSDTPPVSSPTAGGDAPAQLKARLAARRRSWA